MKIQIVLIMVFFLSSCDIPEDIVERREVENSSLFMGKTFETKIPLAYKINLPRFNDVSWYLKTNSATIFADEADRLITQITNRCTGCMGKNRLITPIRIEYIPIGTKFTVVDEYLLYAAHDSWFFGKSISESHYLILKDEFGKYSEVGELAFDIDFADERFVNRDLKKEEIFILDNIDTLKKNKKLSLIFCIADMVVSKSGNINDFVSDFKLESQISFEKENALCDNGYKLTFKTIEAYLTSVYYFHEWRLRGEWHKFNKAM